MRILYSTYVDTNVRMYVYYTDCNVCECIGMYRYIHMYHMIVCKICMSICTYVHILLPYKHTYVCNMYCVSEGICKGDNTIACYLVGFYGRL